MGYDEYFTYMETTPPYNTIKKYYSIENLKLLDSSEKLPEYKIHGLVMLQLYHSQDNKYFSLSNGLSDDGKALLKTMEAQDLILDLSHLNDYWLPKIASQYGGKCVVSHCACSDLYHDKISRSNSLTKATIQLLGHYNVVFGVSFLNDIISSSPYAGTEDDNMLLHDLTNQLSLFMDIAGSEKIMLGPDFLNCDYFSKTLNAPLRIPALLERNTGYDITHQWLSENGVPDVAIENIFYDNGLHFFDVR
jgi:microsomal dipeptidase-like Zn-dependent dipeptidase